MPGSGCQPKLPAARWGTPPARQRRSPSGPLRISPGRRRDGRVPLEVTSPLPAGPLCPAAMEDALASGYHPSAYGPGRASYEWYETEPFALRAAAQPLNRSFAGCLSLVRQLFGLERVQAEFPRAGHRLAAGGDPELPVRRIRLGPYRV